MVGKSTQTDWEKGGIMSKSPTDENADEDIPLEKDIQINGQHPEMPSAEKHLFETLQMS